MVFCRSHSGEKSSPCSCSLSPCLKNSSMHLSKKETVKMGNRITRRSTGNAVRCPKKKKKVSQKKQDYLAVHW